MNFKDQLKKDLDIFINPLEFAEYHQLGSKEVLMVIDEDSSNQNRARSNDYDHATQNIYESITTIELKSEDYPKPSIGEPIKLDGEIYIVVNTSILDGILKIVLKANESYG